MNKQFLILAMILFFQSCKVFKRDHIKATQLPKYTFEIMDSLAFLQLYGPNPRFGSYSCITEYNPNCHFDTIVIYTVKNGVFKYDTIPRPGVKKIK